MYVFPTAGWCFASLSHCRLVFCMLELLQDGGVQAYDTARWWRVCLPYCRLVVKHFSTLCIVSLLALEIKSSKFYRHHKSRLSEILDLWLNHPILHTVLTSFKSSSRIIVSCFPSLVHKNGGLSLTYVADHAFPYFRSVSLLLVNHPEGHKSSRTWWLIRVRHRFQQFSSWLWENRNMLSSL